MAGVLVMIPRGLITELKRTRASQCATEKSLLESHSCSACASCQTLLPSPVRTGRPVLMTVLMSPVLMTAMGIGSRVEFGSTAIPRGMGFVAGYKGRSSSAVGGTWWLWLLEDWDVIGGKAQHVPVYLCTFTEAPVRVLSLWEITGSASVCHFTSLEGHTCGGVQKAWQPFFLPRAEPVRPGRGCGWLAPPLLSRRSGYAELLPSPVLLTAMAVGRRP